MKTGLLIRVAIDSTAGGWNSPCSERDFCYVPMGVTSLSEKYDPRYGPYRSAVELMVPASAPSRTQWPLRMPTEAHLDPDFENLTYGDGGQRAARMRSVLSNGNNSFIVFYAGLRSIQTNKLVYSIIGFYTIERIVAAPDVPPSDWHRNEHTRLNGCCDQGQVVVFARPGESGRLLNHIPIGEYRQRAYRVTKEILNEWGNIDVKNGYIQRSAFLPRFLDAERFIAWFHAQKPTMVAKNNPERR
jgi:hypothetical protein